MHYISDEVGSLSIGLVSSNKFFFFFSTAAFVVKVHPFAEVVSLCQRYS